MSLYSLYFGLTLSLIATIIGLLEHPYTYLLLRFFVKPFVFLVEITLTVT
jgi:hypothetical protein